MAGQSKTVISGCQQELTRFVSGSGGNNQAYIYLPQGLATLSNTSATDSVAWTDKGTAIFVNATGPAFAYRASSVSLSASCESITDQCATCGTVSYDNGDSFWECRGPEAALTLQCNGTARYNATMAYGDYQYGLLDDTYGNQTLGTEITNKCGSSLPPPKSR